MHVGLDKCQPAVLETFSTVLRPCQLVPPRGVRGLGVPPDRVVVEMGHQVHGPARFGHFQFASVAHLEPMGADDRFERQFGPGTGAFWHADRYFSALGHAGSQGPRQGARHTNPGPSTEASASQSREL